MSRRSPRLTRRERATRDWVDQIRPGDRVVVMQHVHAHSCKAPVLPCTCTPKVRLIVDPAREELKSMLRVDADLRSEIRSTLD